MDNAYALVIGIARYKVVRGLPNSVLNDASDVASLLKDPMTCGYLPENVHLLLDRDATMTEIRTALCSLATRSTPDSTVLIYFSGHGGRIESGDDAGEYLLPVEADSSSAELLAQTAIAGSELADALKALPAQRLVVILDCCHAGGIGELKAADQAAFKQGFSESYYDALKKGRGRVIIASSRNTEVSYVMPDARNSVFTQHLLDGLRGGAATNDGVIRIFDLFAYIQPRVTGDQPGQHPIFKVTVEENFPLALYHGAAKDDSPSSEDGFRYDAYLSYVDTEPDTSWVWTKLVPRLEAADLRLAVSGDVEDPGVERVVSIERGIRNARRTVIVLSEHYLADGMAMFENVLAQTMGIREGRYRLLPVQIDSLQHNLLPTRLAMLTILNLTHPQRAEREFDRLVQALRHPLPDALR